MNERRIELEKIIASGKITDSQMLEFVIRMLFHDDGEPRTVSNPQIREVLMKHPHFDLILGEGVD